METRIIPIGNSKGIRLSKTLLEKYDLTDKVELVLEHDRIILKPIRPARAGWDAAFKKMRAQGDDALVIPDVLDDERFEKW